METEGELQWCHFAWFLLRARRFESERIVYCSDLACMWSMLYNVCLPATPQRFSELAAVAPLAGL